VQFEGIGVIAGPPARATILDVGSAEANEQKAAARIAAEVCNIAAGSTTVRDCLDVEVNVCDSGSYRL
jgi:hypothetical protein